MKKHGFSSDGTRYVVNDTNFIDSADSDLWNERMHMQIDHRGRVKQCVFLDPNWNEYSEKERRFYLRDDDSNAIWTVLPPHTIGNPHNKCESFEFSAGKSDIQWRQTCSRIQINLRLVVPLHDNTELWTITITNTDNKPRRASFYSCLPVGLRGGLSQSSHYDRKLNAAIHNWFPYYVQIPDYYKLKDGFLNVYCLSDTPPTAWELSLARFAGKSEMQSPEALLNKRLASPTDKWEIANERAGGIFQYARKLKPGQSFMFNLAFGPARDEAEIKKIKRRYLRPGGVERALREVENRDRQYQPQVLIETPDRDFDHYVNHWLSRRTLMQAQTIRHTFAPQGRNVIQDAMGGIYTDPTAARGWFTRIWTHQHTNGWLPHGMPFHPKAISGGINNIPHKDINAWGADALNFYMNETGDFSILEETISFADDRTKSATLYEHICLGLEWLLKDRTRRGLCRIGQGDWNDPLNMAGRGEKGESIWLCEALTAALQTWAPVMERRGEKRRAVKFRNAAAKLSEAINRLAWDGKWYARGFDDNGKPFGVSARRYGRIFLNAQSWAVISGIAPAARKRQCLAAAARMLETTAGPITLTPPYPSMDENIGKLTQKIPGWNENGSVYCHAALFYALALYLARDSQHAFDIMRALLPGYGDNTIVRAGQIPLYVPNFYRGPASGINTGKSSHNTGTGTAPWFYRVVIAHLLGVRAEYDGLIIDPQLPAKWQKARIKRIWRGATYEISIRRGRQPGLTVDGQAIKGNKLPVMPHGASCKVEAVI